MAFLIDNLTAVVVGTVLLLAMLAVQHRGQERAIEATARYQSQAAAATFLNTVERDVENARSLKEMDAVFGAHRLTLHQAYGADGEPYTRQFVFPTLVGVDTVGTDHEMALVTYEVMPTGDSVRVGPDYRPTYRAERWVLLPGETAPKRAGGSGALVDFDVTAIDEKGVKWSSLLKPAATPPQFHLSIEAASATAAPRDGADRAHSLASTRHARTVRVSGAYVSDQSLGTKGAAVSALPRLPGDPTGT